jgi:hypothetical protein
MGMAKNQSRKDLQKTSYQNQVLANANFSNSDLRGADFSGADLTGADFTNVRTGITVAGAILIFFIALGVSLLSGYVAMLAGRTVQTMLASKDQYQRIAGIITIVIVLLFIIYYYLRGGTNAIRHLTLPVVIAAATLGIIAYVSGLGTGMGMLYLVCAVLLVAVMFIVGTIARTAAGALSNILFIVVALSGGMFGKSVGGGIGTVVMAISCAMISKKALSGAKGFDTLARVATLITRKFGTSFRNAKLTGANFSQSKIRNADFTHADISSVNWGDSKKINCLIDEDTMVVIK